MRVLTRTFPAPEAYGDLIGPFQQATALDVQRTLSQWPGYAPTPLRDLTGAAQKFGVRSVLYKDEASRFGPGSFKALGAAYAVDLLLRSPRERKPVLCCATDGNHGRAVAWAARMHGCRCVIFVHSGVSDARVAALEHEDAEVERVSGAYDDPVHAAAARAAKEGWIVVPDTAHPGATEIPLRMMQGYTLLVHEVLEQLDATHRPTHVLVQAGVGALAAAVAAHFRARLRAQAPVIAVVEPHKADCCYQSALHGRRTSIRGALDTVMAELACGEPSLLAWPVLERLARHFLVIDDDSAIWAMRALAIGVYLDSPIVAGQSGAAGFAALMCAVEEPSVRAQLSLNEESRVLVIGTEGAADRSAFMRLTGLTPESVGRQRKG